MGFLQKRRERKAEEAARRAAAAEQAALARWEQERAQLVDMIDTARSADELVAGDMPAQLPIHLKKNEQLLAILDGCALIEPRRGRGHYEGGYQGFSFKVAKGVRFHTGGSRGTYVAGEERPTPIDSGTVAITDQRVVFQGQKQAREWAYSKLLGVQHDPALPWTALSVSNRQKVSGFLYDDANAPAIRFRLALGLAMHNGTTDELAGGLNQELAEHDAARPAPAAITP